MGNEEGAGAVFGFGVSQMCFYAFGYIYYLIFLLCCDGDRFHWLLLFACQIRFTPNAFCLIKGYQ